MDKNTCYFYHNGTYRVTVAYQRNPEDGSVAYGASFCRPGDQFTKTRGRQIAEGRMNLVLKSFPRVNIQNAPPERWALHEEILRRLEAQEFGYVPTCFRS